MGEIFDVVIIGGGASGLFLAARLPKEMSVAVVESGERIGKKLLATGNGKCNLTNLDMSVEHYNNPLAVGAVIGRFGTAETLAAFSEMKLLVKVMQGRVYPYSECASTVLDVLRRAAENNGAQILTSHRVNCIENKSNMFTVGGSAWRGDRTEEFKLGAKSVVLATGSPATFGRDSVALYTSLGHTARRMSPSLVPINTEREPIRGLQGVRVKAGISLGDRREVGEILFKNFGVSGIAAFNLSAEIARERAHIGDVLSIDLMPEHSLSEVEELLRLRDCATVCELLAGTFHTRLQERIIDMAGCKASDSAATGINALARAIKRFDLKIEGLGDASLAQVMSGGLCVDEFDESLMSKKVRGAYAIGEALDIDGDCGGYNLQWAWSSAGVVADAITKQLNK